MGFKTITIKEDVYKELINAKGKGESFSDFFEKVVRGAKKRPDLRRFYGAWKMDGGEWEIIENRLKETRKLADKNYKERIRRLFQ